MNNLITARFFTIAGYALFALLAASTLYVMATQWNSTVRAQMATSTPVISSIGATTTDTTATIMWSTDIPATSQVAYGTSTSTTTPFSIFSALNTTATTSHSVTLLNLTPSTLYHFQVISGTDATSTGTTTSADMTFTTKVATSSELADLISDLQSLMASFPIFGPQIQSLINQLQSGTTTLPSTFTPGGAQIDQNGATVKAGIGIDFGGRGFGAEEHVIVSRNGVQVGTGFTNLAGSFSTGSMSLPATPGTYTYTFVGQESGITATAVITLVP